VILLTKLKIACPLYILRHEAEEDLFAVLEKIKSLGFDGVELLGLFGKAPAALRQELDKLALEAFGDHVPLDAFFADIAGTIAAHRQIGCRYLTVALPQDTVYGTPLFYGRLDKIRTIAAACRAAGIVPLYHNHGFDYEGSDSIADAILDGCGALCFEPDVGWMAVKDVDPAAKLVRYQDRCPVIHLKDFYRQDGAADFEFRPVGFGIVNIPRLLPYCLDCRPEWLVADHDDAGGRDPYGDMALCLRYIKDGISLL
jgi:Xylose isomerase-like TIM barrel.